jgi:hypothetical protein
MAFRLAILPTSWIQVSLLGNVGLTWVMAFLLAIPTSWIQVSLLGMWG